jgi:hypothetical protein
MRARRWSVRELPGGVSYNNRSSEEFLISFIALLT